MRVTIHHRPHNDVARHLQERGIGDFFGFGDDDTTTTKGTATSTSTTSTSSSTTSATSATSTSATSATTSATSTSATESTSTSASSTSTSTSSSATSVTPPTSTSSTPTNAAPPPTPPPVQPQSTSVFVSSSGGQAITITSVVFASDTKAVGSSVSASSASATSSHKPTPFLQNKAASGVVFTLVAIVSLVVIISIATTAIRKSRKSKLERDALEDGGINWPSPGDAGAAVAAPGSLRQSTEKAAWNDSGSVYSHGGAPAAGTGYGSDHGHGAPGVVSPPQRTMTPGVPPSVQYIQPQHTGYASPQPPSSHGHGYYAQGPDDYAYGPPGMQQYAPLNNSYALGYAPDPTVAFPAGADGGYAVGGPPQIPPPTLTVNTSSVPMRRTSLVNANQPNTRSPEDPTSPTSSWENHSNSTHGTTSDRVQRRISHSRGLDPMLPALPRSPALPEAFGLRESADEKPLRVANQ